MRVVVTGGTGFIGSGLCRHLAASGHDPVVLTRDPSGAERRLGPGVQVQRWQPREPGDWERALNGADGVINLAGESIGDRRWTAAQKAAIRESRIVGTRLIVEAIARAEPRPRVLLSASASGYYGPRGDEPVHESDGPGDDFLARVCREWEREARAAESLGLRVALIRTGVALGGNGGALARLLPPFKMFVGGPLGSGRQGFPWVHLADVVGIYLWALQEDAVAGPLNASGPEPLTNRQFCQVLGRALGRPCWAPVPAFVLKILLGEMAEPLLLHGQRMVPARTQQLGYRFKFQTAEAALRDILG
jgi:uncharacterized protein (TIGR01777 family)